LAQWLYEARKRNSESQKEKRSIHYEKLRELLAIDSCDLLEDYHKGWVEEYRGANNTLLDINDEYSIR